MPSQKWAIFENPKALKIEKKIEGNFLEKNRYHFRVVQVKNYKKPNFRENLRKKKFFEEKIHRNSRRILQDMKKIFLSQFFLKIWFLIVFDP